MDLRSKVEIIVPIVPMLLTFSSDNDCETKDSVNGFKPEIISGKSCY
jgi:hypothetical protein